MEKQTVVTWSKGTHKGGFEQCQGVWGWDRAKMPLNAEGTEGKNLCHAFHPYKTATSIQGFWKSTQWIWKSLQLWRKIIMEDLHLGDELARSWQLSAAVLRVPLPACGCPCSPACHSQPISNDREMGQPWQPAWQTGRTETTGGAAERSEIADVSHSMKDTCHA